MLINSTRLHFSKEICVSKIAVAYDSTFVILSRDYHIIRPCSVLIHLRRDSSIINEYHFQEDVDSFVMLNVASLMIPLVDKKCLLKIDLSKKQYTSFPFRFNTKDKGSIFIRLFTFGASGLFALCQTQDDKLEVNNQSIYTLNIKMSYFNK
jgi:hypothetical protein